MNPKIIYRCVDAVITVGLVCWLSHWGLGAVGVGLLLALWFFVDGLVRGNGWLK